MTFGKWQGQTLEQAPSGAEPAPKEVMVSRGGPRRADTGQGGWGGSLMPG